MGLGGPLLCVYRVALVVRCLSSAWWAGWVRAGLSWFVCLQWGRGAVGSVGLGGLWGGVSRLFWVPVRVCLSGVVCLFFPVRGLLVTLWGWFGVVLLPSRLGVQW